MKMFINFVVIVLLLTGGSAFQAQAETMQLETIKLQHKPAEDIIPLIEPLLPKNAVISGEGYKIILKTTAENLPQVKQLIAELDIPLRQLQIAVSLDPVVLQQHTTLPAYSTDITGKEKTSPAPTAQSDAIQIYKTQGQQATTGLQVIQVLQDRWTMIRTGQSIPVMNRVRNPDGTITESISYQQVNQGLRIRPHLAGKEVVLGVQPFYEAASQSDTGRQLYYKQERQTKTRLGTWISIDTTTGNPIQAVNNKAQQNPTAPGASSLIYIRVDVAQ
jgi:hypothetical protein